MKIADLNGDGRLDFLVASGLSPTVGFGTVTLLTKDATGPGYTTSRVGLAQGPLAVAAGDVSGDGKLDIVVPNRDQNSVTIFVKDAAGAGYTPTVVPLPGALGLPVDAELGDLDGDGRLDIATANSNAGSLAVLRNITFKPVPAVVGGTVPATLSLTLGGPATFGAFTPGKTDDYTATTSANVISTAGDAALSFSDPGHLANGSFTLPQPLVVELSKSTWSAPVSNDRVTITFKQHINSTDALRTGAYNKTLTFTLSTTTP